MKFCSLGSGSKGNATLVQSGSTTVMIDCGFPLKQVLPRMAERGVSPQDLDAILVTHEHGDHISGVSRLARKSGTPVYLTPGTRRSKRIDEKTHCIEILPDKTFTLGDLVINPVTVPHDARESCQFVLKEGETSLGVLTDLGSISAHVREAFGGCQALVLEANHDVGMLMNGPYPYSLKKRVAGDWGHLSNEQAAAFIRAAHEATETLVLAHVSQQNNCPVKVRDLFAEFETNIRDVQVATQDQGYDWIDVVNSNLEKVEVKV